MPSEASDPAARGQRVDAAIAAYLEAVDAGRAPSPSEFIEQHEDIAEELEAFFTGGERFERMAEPLRAAVRLDEATPRRAPASGRPGAGRTPGAAVDPASGAAVGSFGDYEVLEEIARGGMGVVYKARQISLNRLVALKMILAGRLASNEDVRRFRSEAEAAANLDHPGIVPIYEVGEHGGQHYFSMGYVEGRSLAERLREGPMPPREAAALLAGVCEAVQCAHGQGVLHRDLKPANILLEENRPRITDFGLAKRLEGDSKITGTGEILGTPSYMSPEQATAGATHRVGPATDIYSLGAILYQLLTGRPPFQAETRLATLSQLLDSDPVPPRLLNRDVPRDLEAICMKCLEKDPAHRYASAGALGEELRRYLEGEAIQASGVNLLDRVTRALRQSRHEEQFRPRGLGLMAFGIVIFLSHVAIYLFEGGRLDSRAAYFVPRIAMFSALLLMLWKFRGRSVLPANPAERLVWVVWSGYVLALAAVNAARSVLGHDQRESYASFAVLAGFGFLVMGGHVWGGGYLVGLVFLLAAPLLALRTDLAPLVFGALWAGALFSFGAHYWRRGRAGRAAASDPPEGA